MDLPIALDDALKALLASHAVSSWKIAAERQNLTVILRLRPVPVPNVCHNGVPHVNTVAFRRKSPSQMQRDRQRMQSFRERECAVYVPGNNLLVSDQSAVNKRSVIVSEIQSGDASIVVDNNSDSGSRANDDTGSLASAASVVGTGVTQESGSDQEVSEAESDADSVECEAATLPSPLTGSPTSADAEVISEDTARNEDTPTSRADTLTAKGGTHGVVDSEVVTGSMSPQKFLCQETAPGSQTGKGIRVHVKEEEGKREKKTSDSSVRSINLHDSGVDSLHVRNDSFVTFENEEVGAIGGQREGLGGEGRGGGMRKKNIKECDKSDSSKHQSVNQILESTGYDGKLRFPSSQTDIHLSPSISIEQYYEQQNKLWHDHAMAEQQNKLWHDHAMAVHQVNMPAYGTYPPHPYPYPAPLPMMPTMPPVSMGYGEGLSFEGPSEGVSEHYDQCMKTESDTDSDGHKTLGKKDRDVAKGMNEECVTKCTEGRKLWSSMAKKGYGNNERYGRERRDTYRRDDDRPRYRGGRGYRDSERFRGRGVSTRWARDYHD